MLLSLQMCPLCDFVKTILGPYILVPCQFHHKHKTDEVFILPLWFYGYFMNKKQMERELEICRSVLLIIVMTAMIMMTCFVVKDEQL